MQAAPGQAKVQATFEIRNSGHRELVLGDINSSCGCTSATLSTRRVPPGGTATARVEGRPPASGERAVEVSIASNTAEKLLTLRLMLAGASLPPYLANHTRAVSFGEDTSTGRAQEFFVETREQASQRPWVHAVRSSVPEIVCEGGFVNQADVGAGVVMRRYSYRATIQKPLAVGEFAGSILVSSSGNQPETILRLPLHGDVPPPIRSCPSLLMAHVGRGQKPPPLQFSLVATDQTKALRLKLQSGCPEVYELIQDVHQDRHTARFALRPRATLKGPLKTNLVFSSEDPGGAVVKLPLQLLCSDSVSGSSAVTN